MPIKDRIKLFQIQSEPEKKGDFAVSDMDSGKKAEWRDYELPKLRKAGERDYASVKAKFGSLAATDSDKVERQRKDSRFAVNPLLKEPLAIEEEERRVIQAKVQAGIDAISAQAKADAQKQGYAEGLKKGYQEAFQRWTQEGKVRLQAFDAFLKSCDSAKDDIFRENERFVMDVIFRIARMVVLREVSHDEDFVLRIAKGIIERVGVRENIRIEVNPRDKENVDMIREGLQETFGKLQNLSVEVSGDVKLGGCIVETEWSAVDASLETQLQNLYESLLGERRGAAGGGQSQGQGA